jgi:biotin transport system substrate-specific component
MQVLFVILAGLYLGPVWGPASQLAYLTMGLAGAPFFAAAPYAGPAVLFGPSGGYLWGFVLAAGIAGLVSQSLKSKRRRPSWKLLPTLMIGNLAAVATIYVLGTSWLAFWLSSGGRSASLAFALGVKPFAAIDTLKALLASAIWAGCMGKGKAYGR